MTLRDMCLKVIVVLFLTVLACQVTAQFFKYKHETVYSVYDNNHIRESTPRSIALDEENGILYYADGAKLFSANVSQPGNGSAFNYLGGTWPYYGSDDDVKVSDIYFRYPIWGITLTNNGSLLVLDNNYIRQVDLKSLHTKVVAGNHTFPKKNALYPTPANQISLSGTYLTYSQTRNEIYIADSNYIQKITPFDSVKQVLASSQIRGICSCPRTGNVYFTQANRLKMLNISTNIVKDIAGNGSTSYGDGGLATEAGFESITSCFVSGTGEIYIADKKNIRKIFTNGTITTSHTMTGMASYGSITSMVVSKNETFYLINNNYGFRFKDGNELVMISQQNWPPVSMDLYNVAVYQDYLVATKRKWVNGFTNIAVQITNGTATELPIYPSLKIHDGLVYYYDFTNSYLTTYSLTTKQTKRLFPLISQFTIADSKFVYFFNFEIKKRNISDFSGSSTTLVAGTSVSGFKGENGSPALEAQFRNILDLAILTKVDENGTVVDELYLVDSNRIRLIKDGLIYTIAGNDTIGSSGDGGLATSAQINPIRIAVTSDKTIYILEQNYHKIRMISNKGLITTIAGTGETPGFLHNNGYDSRTMRLSTPNSISLGENGTIFISEIGRIVKLEPYTCQDGYFGEDCSMFTCSGKTYNETDVCLGRGKCILYNKCNCTDKGKYGGDNCELPFCFERPSNDPYVCSGNGVCTLPDVCQCKEGSAGKNCELPTCGGIPASSPNVCSGAGACVALDVCQCANKKFDKDCNTKSLDDNYSYKLETFVDLEPYDCGEPDLRKPIFNERTNTLIYSHFTRICTINVIDRVPVHVVGSAYYSIAGSNPRFDIGMDGKFATLSISGYILDKDGNLHVSLEYSRGIMVFDANYKLIQIIGRSSKFRFFEFIDSTNSFPANETLIGTILAMASSKISPIVYILTRITEQAYILKYDYSKNEITRFAGGCCFPSGSENAPALNVSLPSASFLSVSPINDNVFIGSSRDIYMVDIKSGMISLFYTDNTTTISAMEISPNGSVFIEDRTGIKMLSESEILTKAPIPGKAPFIEKYSKLLGITSNGTVLCEKLESTKLYNFTYSDGSFRIIEFTLPTIQKVALNSVERFNQHFYVLKNGFDDLVKINGLSKDVQKATTYGKSISMVDQKSFLLSKYDMVSFQNASTMQFISKLSNINSPDTITKIAYSHLTNNLYVVRRCTIEKYTNLTHYSLVAGSLTSCGFFSDKDEGVNALIPIPTISSVFIWTNSSGGEEIYFMDTDRVSKVRNGKIYVVAGGGYLRIDTSPLMAKSIYLGGIQNGIHVTSAGELYIVVQNRILKVHLNGVVSVVGGTGYTGWGVDNIPSKQADISPNSLYVDEVDSSIYFTENSSKLRKLTPTGCEDGFYGEKCSMFTCFGIPYNDSSACNGNGKCLYGNMCSCNSGYSGKTCLPVCNGRTNETPNVCNGKGFCISPEVCKCNETWSGSDCQSPTCYGVPSFNKSVCSARGTCQSPDNCICAYSYGKNCESTVPSCYGIPASNYLVCSSRGTCLNTDTCACHQPYFDPKCDNYLIIEVNSFQTLRNITAKAKISKGIFEIKWYLNNNILPEFTNQSNIEISSDFLSEGTTYYVGCGLFSGSNMVVKKNVPIRILNPLEMNVNSTNISPNNFEITAQAWNKDWLSLKYSYSFGYFDSNQNKVYVLNYTSQNSIRIFIPYFGSPNTSLFVESYGDLFGLKTSKSFVVNLENPNSMNAQNYTQYIKNEISLIDSIEKISGIISVSNKLENSNSAFRNEIRETILTSISSTNFSKSEQITIVELISQNSTEFSVKTAQLVIDVLDGITNTSGIATEKLIDQIKDTTEKQLSIVASVLDSSIFMSKSGTNLEKNSEILQKVLDLSEKANAIGLNPGQKYSSDKGNVVQTIIKNSPTNLLSSSFESEKSMGVTKISIPKEAFSTTNIASLAVTKTSGAIFGFVNISSLYVTTNATIYKPEISDVYRVQLLDDFTEIPVSGLANNISIEISPKKKPDNYKFTCLYYERITKSFSSKGVSAEFDEETNILKCLTTHLTDFVYISIPKTEESPIVSPKTSTSSGFNNNDSKLGDVTGIAVGVSLGAVFLLFVIIALVVIIALLCCLKKKQSSNSNKQQVFSTTNLELEDQNQTTVVHQNADNYW